MIHRWWTLLAVFVMAEIGVFNHWHHDVVALSGPHEQLVADPRFPEVVHGVVARERVSRQLLERAAVVAVDRGDAHLHVRILERMVAAAPDDGQVRLRLVAALRGVGRVDEAADLLPGDGTLPTAGAAR